MAIETGPVREVDWRRLFPWLRLFRAVRASCGASKVLIAALALVAFWLGERGLDSAFGMSAGDGAATPLAEMPLGAWPDGARSFAKSALSIVAEPALAVVSPFWNLFQFDRSPKEFWRSACVAVWAVVVWGLAGGAIARIAVAQLATAQRVPLKSALRFSARNAHWLVGAPLCPMIAIAFFAGACATWGLLYRIPSPIAHAVAGTFAFLPILAGLVMALLLAGLGVGWPLITLTIAAEHEDGFDAISRMYSYVQLRPIRLAAYVALAWLIGAVGFLFVRAIAALALRLAIWGLSLGGPDTVVFELFGPNATPPIAALPHGFWVSAVAVAVRGWVYSYFWTAATVVYLLIRLDVDGKPYTDVSITEPGALPAGPPGAADAPAAEPPTADR